MSFIALFCSVCSSFSDSALRVLAWDGVFPGVIRIVSAFVLTHHTAPSPSRTVLLCPAISSPHFPFSLPFSSFCSLCSPLLIVHLIIICPLSLCPSSLPLSSPISIIGCPRFSLLSFSVSSFSSSLSLSHSLSSFFPLFALSSASSTLLPHFIYQQLMLSPLSSHALPRTACI